MKLFAALLMMGMFPSLSAPILAQEPPWPAKPIQLIVPGGAGGVVDIRGRWLAERLAPALGQPVIVENKLGAGGNIGMGMAARSKPDGYTLVIIHQGTMTINPHLYSRLGYDPLTDFIPITRVGLGSLLLAVNPKVPATTVGELVQLAKANPGKLTFSSPGVGTPPHLAGELFKRVTAIDVAHVAYKGGGQAVADLIGGHITFTIEGLTVLLPQVKAGKLRALGVTGPRRVASLPEIPTIAEAGIAGYEFQGWVGVAAPAGTPKPIIARLYREMSTVLGTQEARDYFGEFGAVPGADPPDVFAAAIRAEHAQWGTVIREAGIKAE